jgi:hypothetical protein
MLSEFENGGIIRLTATPRNPRGEHEQEKKNKSHTNSLG